MRFNKLHGKTLYTAIAILLSAFIFILTGCGGGDIEITGIYTRLTTSQDIYCDETILNGDTVFENDYNLQIDNEYLLIVALGWKGSKQPYLPHEHIIMNYDSELMNIMEISGGVAHEAHYKLICKKEFSYAAIIFEYSEFSDTIIISAK